MQQERIHGCLPVELRGGLEQRHVEAKPEGCEKTPVELPEPVRVGLQVELRLVPRRNHQGELRPVLLHPVLPRRIHLVVLPVPPVGFRKNRHGAEPPPLLWAGSEASTVVPELWHDSLEPSDAGPEPFGAGLGPFDAGLGLFDVGLEPFDAGLGPFDAGPEPFDAGLGPYVAGLVPHGAGPELLDAWGEAMDASGEHSALAGLAVEEVSCASGLDELPRSPLRQPRRRESGVISAF